jgi:drug/metabolite transporter (DMT)-like permease
MSDRRTGILLAGGGSLLISLDALGLRLTKEDAWTNAFWLGLFIAVSMFVFVQFRTGTSLPATARAQGWPILVSSLLQATSGVFFIISLSLTNVSNTVAILAAVPVTAALIAHFAIGERTDRRTWTAIAAVVAGIFVIVWGSLGAGTLTGDLFAVGAIAAFSTNATLWRRFPELNRQAVVGLGGLVIALVAAWPAQISSTSPKALGILAALGLLTAPAGRVGVASSTRYLSAAQVGLFVPVETIAATTWAWLFLEEPPTTATIIGGLIVIGAVVLGTRSPAPSAPTVPATPI